MEFRILACGFDSTIYKDKWFDDLFDQLPSDYSISYGDIRRFFNDENYKVTNEENEVLSLERSDDFLGYFDFWENCREFGLPYNSGWLNELPWTVDFIKYFNRIQSEIEIFNIKKK